MTDRRIGGLVLLVLVALAAVTLPNLSGRRVAGQPLALIVPGPPVPGTCLSNRARPAASTDRVGATAVACDGPHRTEVVAVYPVPPDPIRVDVGHGQVAVVDRCSWDLAAYLGGFDVLLASDPSLQQQFGPWLARQVVLPSRLEPDRTQRLLGQRWTACVANAGVKVFTGSVRSSYSGSRMPPQLARCRAAAKDAGYVPCSEPHSTELIATTQYHYPAPDQAGLVVTCRALVTRLTGLDDPTAGNALAVVVARDQVPVDGVGVFDESRTYEAGCAVSAVGGRKLVGSVIGLGGAPLPWAG